jgi:hypothetical protein
VPQQVPVFNRANQKLPAWLRVRGEFRERFEGFDNLGFTEGRDDEYALTRLRFNATITPSQSLSFQVNVHDARVAGKTVGPTTAPFRGPFDLRVGFADVGSAKAPWPRGSGARSSRSASSGCSAPPLGEHRPRVGRGRGILRNKAFQVDMFVASLVRSLPDEFDKSGNGNRLGGAYATTTKLIPKATVEPYVFFRRDVNLRSELGAIGSHQPGDDRRRTAGRLPLGSTTAWRW